MENLIRRAAVLLRFGLTEAQVRDTLAEDTNLTENQIFFAIKAAPVYASL